MPVNAFNSLAPAPNEPAWRALSRDFRDCKRTFIPHVPSWQSYQAATQLKWDRVKYSDSNQQAADRRGVYAFALCSETILGSTIPPFGYILYVGETGNTGAETLKTRLRNYRNKKAQELRPKVYAMIDVWREHLYFYFAEVTAGVSTKQCETLLLDTLLPPCNEKDFSATVRTARKEALT